MKKKSVGVKEKSKKKKYEKIIEFTQKFRVYLVDVYKIVIIIYIAVVKALV